MFEKFNWMAERAATRASRRDFLGRVGRGAMALAAAAAGLVALPGQAQAASVCGPGSLSLQCRNRPVGTACGTRNRPGVCTGAPNCQCSPRKPRRGG